MSQTLLHWSLLAAQLMLGLAFLCASWRVARGPGRRTAWWGWIRSTSTACCCC
ncbi:hypothetical protein ACFQU7_27410 [Pseudoroseomonas wenyumeiae]